ncbi:hypothetical protein AALP_AA6G130800 [Arabis alpina]|uniref:Uncharacterized protein n=1 Tax=Arabis alpina TaxID=50452 RepID=A0A087GNX8_ARAAL|nr:hypothetical protein AALP_AA6G130800 [Arabis alpina]
MKLSGIGSAISLFRGCFSVEPEGVRKRSAYRWKGLGLKIPDQVSDHDSEAKEESCQRLRSEATDRLRFRVDAEEESI